MQSKFIELHPILLVVVALLYGGWARYFIARSAVETTYGRYFCLFDDAMISLRYAWNLAHGEGLVWNPGERVEGITSFLSTLCMVPGAWFLDKSTAALLPQIAGIPLVLGVALSARALSRSLEGPSHDGLITVAAVLVYYPLSYWALMGMETGWLAALTTTSLLLAQRMGSDPRASALLGLLLGLTFATRPDAAVTAVVILAFRAVSILLRHRHLGALKNWLIEAGVFAAIVGGLTMFRFVYYGSPVPNTYQLKMAGWPLHWRLLNGWKFVVPFLQTIRYLLCLALCSVVFRRDGRRLLLLAFAGSVIGCQIWVGGDAWTYWRMLVPAVVALTVLAVDGARSLFLWLLRPERRALVPVLSLGCLALALWTADDAFMNELVLETPAYMVSLNQSTVQAGLDLSRYADPRGSVAVAAAGALPYYSGLRGVDVLGKSDRNVARLPMRGVDGDRVTPGHNKFDLRYSIVKLRPDVIYDAASWSRHDGNDVLEFVAENYVAGGSFWLRRDSPYIHWDRLPHINEQ